MPLSKFSMKDIHRSAWRDSQVQTLKRSVEKLPLSAMRAGKKKVTLRSTSTKQSSGCDQPSPPRCLEYYQKMETRLTSVACPTSSATRDHELRHGNNVMQGKQVDAFLLLAHDREGRQQEGQIRGKFRQERSSAWDAVDSHQERLGELGKTSSLTPQRALILALTGQT